MGARYRVVTDVVVEEGTYMNKVDQEDLGQKMMTTLETVVMEKYGVAVEKSEFISLYRHEVYSSASDEGMELASDGKNGDN